jgi:hypothetical protein
MISRCMNCVLYSRTVLMNSQACKQVKFRMISQATDLSHLITIVWKDSKSSQHMSKLYKIIQSYPKFPFNLTHSNRSPSSKLNVPRFARSVSTSEQAWLRAGMNPPDKCLIGCTMLHHVAPTIFMQLLLLLWGSWCRRVIDPANVCTQNLSIHTTCYAWCFWRVDLWSFLLRCRHASIVWTMSRHLCQKDRNSVRPISRQLKSFLWQGLLWMTQSHCMYEKADHSLLHNVCIVSR